jgi:hypothetical protein
MMNQSKTPFEAEIDLAELVDFWRLNAYYLEWLYTQQPDQAPGELNRFDWRPLEGFVLAISPFNFYSIGGNLATAPALVGNVVLWKPARSVLLANYRIMQLLLEAGLPAGVINFVPFASRYTDAVLGHPALAGLHFTGSYETLVQLWQRIGEHLPVYRNFPASWAKPAAKTSSSCTLRRTSRWWRRTPSAERMSIRGRSAPRRRGYTSRPACGSPSRHVCKRSYPGSRGVPWRI